MSKTTVYEIFILVFLFFLSFSIRLIALYQTPYANGWDGYYYIMQMYTCAENGAMRAPDFSLIYPFYIALFYITSDYIVAFKLGGALLAAFFTITIYFFSKYFVTSRFSDSNSNLNTTYIALFVAAFSIFSPTLTYFTTQFPKNLLGIIFLIWLIYFMSKKEVIGIILFFVLAFATHRLSAGLASIVLIFNILKKQHLIVLIIAVAVCVIGLSLLPGILHVSDIERFAKEFELNFPLYELIEYFGIDRLSVLWMIELVLLFFMFLFSAIVLINRQLNGHKSSVIYIQLFFILLILSTPIFKFENAGLGFRLYLSFNILSLLLLPCIIHYFPKRVLLIASLIVLIASFFSYKSYNPKKLDPPYHDYFQIVSELKTKINPETTLVVAHQGLAQLIIIYSSSDATNWQPKKKDPNYNNIYRVAANISYYYYNKYLTNSQLKKLKHLYKNYYLLSEEMWQQFKEKVNQSNNTSLKEKLTDWYNPSVPKPQYLLKGRKKDYIQ